MKHSTIPGGWILIKSLMVIALLATLLPAAVSSAKKSVFQAARPNSEKPLRLGIAMHVWEGRRARSDAPYLFCLGMAVDVWEGRGA